MVMLWTTLMFAIVRGAVSVLPPPPPPQPPFFSPTEEEETQASKGHATVTVQSDVGWVGPSQQFNLIVVIVPDSGWHVYWKNAGASGAPTEIEITAPDGFCVGEPLFPRPHIFHGEEGQTYGYTKEVAIFVPITAPAYLTDDHVQFQVATRWLACRKICVMGESATKMTLSTDAHAQGPLHRDLRLKRWQELLPKPLSSLDGGTSIIVGDTLHVSGTSEASHIHFIGVERKGVRFFNSEMSVRDGDTFRLPIPLKIEYSGFNGNSIVVEGLLLLGRNDDDPAFVVYLIADQDNGFQEQ